MIVVLVKNHCLPILLPFHILIFCTCTETTRTVLNKLRWDMSEMIPFSNVHITDHSSIRQYRFFSNCENPWKISIYIMLEYRLCVVVL